MLKCLFLNLAIYQALFFRRCRLQQLQTIFWQTVFIFQKGCPLIIRIACFIWGSRELFFIGLEGQKPAGSSGGYDHLPLEKLSYIITLMTPPKKSYSWLISFFLLPHCHLVLSKSSVKSCLGLTMATLTFWPKNEPWKCGDFGDPQQIHQKLLKSYIVIHKSPAQCGCNTPKQHFSSRSRTQDIISSSCLLFGSDRIYFLHPL